MKKSVSYHLPAYAAPPREPIPFPNAAPKVKWSQRLLNGALMAATAASAAAIVAFLLVL